jgi:hypothetical protein
MGGAWQRAETRILLHSFEWIVRTALLNWFLALDVKRPETVDKPQGHAVHHDAFVAVSRRLEAISPVRVEDVPYAIWLIDITDSADGLAVDIAIGAKSQAAQHTARLHLDRDRLTDADGIARMAAAVIERIVTGKLPPGAAEML